MTKDNGPQLSKTDLLRSFSGGEKPPEAFRVGAEWERFGVLDDSGVPLPFVGERSIEAIYRKLIDTREWHPEPEVAGGPIISLSKGPYALTLEPGGQFELSGAPHRFVRDLCWEMSQVRREVADVAKSFGVRWLALGFHPWARREDMPLVPKLRYPVMLKYMPTRGPMAADMMLRTSTVQVTVDFESERDAMRKLLVGLKLQPVVTAIYANSPWLEGQASEHLGMRAKVWLNMDPDRTGLIKAMWKDEASYEDYLEWALDVPMFLVRRGSSIIHNTGQTFRDFMEKGAEGSYPTMKDWEVHLRTLFPEVRLKNTLELRGIDSQPWALACSVPALWKGLLYHAPTLEKVASLCGDWSYEEVEGMREDIARRGAHASFRGEPLWEVAEKLVTLSHEGLEALQHVAGDTSKPPHDASFLAPLEALVASRQTPADQLLAATRDASDLKKALLADNAAPDLVD